jgi:hypothetical protein
MRQVKHRQEVVPFVARLEPYRSQMNRAGVDTLAASIRLPGGRRASSLAPLWKLGAEGMQAAHGIRQLAWSEGGAAQRPGNLNRRPAKGVPFGRLLDHHLLWISRQ